jgi:tripartite-type tricarboxylate transporter receptor subunit TctC
MVFDIVSTTRPMWESKQVKVLGTGGDTRSRIMPTVPTIAEAGLPGYQALTWFAMVGPPGLPATISDKISADVAEALKIDEVKQRIEELGMDTAGLNPTQSGKFFAQEAEHWGKIVKAAGISFD